MTTPSQRALEAAKKFWETYMPSMANDDSAAVIAVAQAIQSAAEEARREIVESLDGYFVHNTGCESGSWSSGRPTPDGGYETKWAGVWRKEPYTPSCNCGLDDILKSALAGDKDEVKS